MKTKQEYLEINDKKARNRLILAIICFILFLGSASYYRGVVKENSIVVNDILSNHVGKLVGVKYLHRSRHSSITPLALVLIKGNQLKKYVIAKTASVYKEKFTPFIGENITISVDRHERVWSIKSGDKTIIPYSYFLEHNSATYTPKKQAFSLMLMIVLGAGFVLAIINYLWLRFYKRILYQKGIVKISESKIEFIAAKGYFLYWCLIYLICFIPLVYLVSLSQALLVIFGIFVLGFGILTLQYIRMIFIKNPILILTNKYIEYKPWQNKRIDWDNIQCVDIQIIGGPGSGSVAHRAEPATILVFSLKDGKAYIPWYDFIEKIRYHFSKKMMIRLNLNVLEIEAEEFIEILGKFVCIDTSNWLKST